MKKKKALRKKCSIDDDTSALNLKIDGRITDSRIKHAIMMNMEGSKIYEIADHFGVHRKTVGRWLKKVRDNLEIDVNGNEFTGVFMAALEEHGELLGIEKILVLKALHDGDRTQAYALSRRYAASLKQRDKVIERFGPKFKSRLQTENEELKTLCAWSLILIERLEDNMLAVEMRKNEPWANPREIDKGDIEEFRQCPELFQMDRYVVGLPKAQDTGYFDSHDLEMLLTRICLGDPAFNLEKDDPIKFASKRIFGTEAPF